MIISLTGFMGCGKSSVGRKLSELLCCPFIDLDSVTEERAGRSIPEIFASEGEAAFRAMELDALRTILTDSGVEGVLSLGGGTVMTKECADLVHEQTKCIYLRASIDTLVRNLKDEAEGRPMLNGSNQVDTLRNRIEELMSVRSSTYEATAHVIIDTDGKSVDSLAQEIISRLK